MAYKANDIANYIISYCNDLNISISNLKLQKLLYFAWIDYFKQTGEYLFKDDICAWQLGPVVPSVYFDFCAYGGRSISGNRKETELLAQDQQIVDQSLAEYANYSASKLVERSHSPGGAWREVFKQGGAITCRFHSV